MGLGNEHLYTVRGKFLQSYIKIGAVNTKAHEREEWGGGQPLKNYRLGIMLTTWVTDSFILQTSASCNIPL